MSAPHAPVPALREIEFLVVGGVNDAPGFKIVSDGHGGLKIVPVPGWNPEASRELQAALKVLGAVAGIKDEKVSQMVLSAVGALAQTEVTKLAGAKAGVSTVVIING
jgi:hypothetical protein